MKIKYPFLFLTLLVPMFFNSVLYAAMLINEQSEIRDRKKINLTQEEQIKVNTDLFKAIQRNHLENVIAALDAGADVTDTQGSMFNEYPIQQAARFCCQPDIFTKLFLHGADFQVLKKPQNENLLHLLIGNLLISKPHLVETIKTFLRHNVSLHVVNFEHDTPLHIATDTYSIACGESFKNDLEWEQKKLMYYRVIELFLFAGADYEKKNIRNKIALDLIDQEHKAPIERLMNIASFFNFNLSKNLSNLLLPYVQQIPSISTIIVDYFSPQLTQEEQKLWDELAPIRHMQQELFVASQKTFEEEVPLVARQQSSVQKKEPLTARQKQLIRQRFADIMDSLKKS